MGMDGSVHFQFQKQASLFSEESMPEWNELILTGDQRTLRSIVSTVVLEGNNRAVYRKLAFMFGDAAPDSDQ